MKNRTISAELESVLTNLDTQLDLIRSSFCSFSLKRETLDRLRESRRALDQWRTEYRNKHVH